MTGSDEEEDCGSSQELGVVQSVHRRDPVSAHPSSRVKSRRQGRDLSGRTESGL